MKSSKNYKISKPFEKLGEMFEKKSIKLPTCSTPIDKAHEPIDTIKPDIEHTIEPDTEPDREDDEKLFYKAMAGVIPSTCNNKVEIQPKPSKAGYPSIDSEAHTIRKLDELLKSGKGFVVADTPEYIEGTGYHADPRITKRLHKGDYSMQAHIDLHGLYVAEAKEAFDIFLKNSISTGIRAVLIIHGRGLSSPSKPVLKAKVREWLTRGVWRKWVIAYTSARACDGGAGATYVLLRKRPITKRNKKQSP